MQLRKTHLKRAKFFGISLILFFISLLILLGTPRVVNLAESGIILSSNLPDQTNQLTEAKISGLAKEPIVELVIKNMALPSMSAKAVYVLDLDLDKVLYERNSSVKLPPASTTKIMTAVIAQEYYKAADVLVVPQQAMVGGSTMGLSVGENMTFRSLLYGMLLNSGNDAAFTIAANYPNGLYLFIEKMNQRALDLGLKNTHFENPAGFDSLNHYSSAEDLTKIAKEALKDPYLTKIFSTKETSVISYDKTQSHSLKNLNKLLGEDGVIGIKTGFTEKAGENLVALVDRNGHKVLTVMLNSDDRFGETRALIDWVYNNFEWQIK